MKLKLSQEEAKLLREALEYTLNFKMLEDHEEAILEKIHGELDNNEG